MIQPFNNFLESAENFLVTVNDWHSPTVVDGIVSPLQCAVDTTRQLLQRVAIDAVEKYLSTLDQDLLPILETVGKPRKTHQSLLCSYGYRKL